METFTIFHFFIIGLFLILAVLIGWKYGKTRTMAKYAPGTCVCFEHNNQKKSGVIIRSEVLVWRSCSTPLISFSYNDFEINNGTRIRYLIDTKHAKYDAKAHFHSSNRFIKENNQMDSVYEDEHVCLIWVDERDIGCLADYKK